jgi:hypothetical protein
MVFQVPVERVPVELVLTPLGAWKYVHWMCRPVGVLITFRDTALHFI